MSKAEAVDQLSSHTGMTNESVRLNETHARALDELVRDYAEAMGEPPEKVRRLVEIGVLTRGLNQLREEIGRRGTGRKRTGASSTCQETSSSGRQSKGSATPTEAATGYPWLGPA